MVYSEYSFGVSFIYRSYAIVVSFKVRVRFRLRVEDDKTNHSYFETLSFLYIPAKRSIPLRHMVSKAFLKSVWLLAFPVILTNLLQASMTVIDTIMIGRLGPEALSAVGMGNMIRLLVLISILSVSGGAMSLMAQARGGRDPYRMSFVTRQSLISGLLLSFVITLIGLIISKPLLQFMSSDNSAEIVRLGSEYLFVIFLATPFITTNFTINRLMQGAGDTTTPFYLSILLLVLNIGFNYIFIFGYGIIPAYGIVGAAYGTMLSRFILSLIGIAILYSGKNIVKVLKGSWKPDRTLVKDILAIGVPSGVQGVFRHGSNIIIMSLVTASSLGSLGAAALAICTQVESLVAYMAVGLNVAGTAIVGKELGRWQPDQAYNKGSILIYLGFGMMAILIIPILIFDREIITLFDPSATAEIIKGSLSYLNTNTYFLPISAFGILITGTLRGAGDTKPAMISSIFGRNLTSLILGYIFAFPMGMDFVGIWYGVIVGRFVDAIYLWYVWRSRKWQMFALKKTEVYRKHLKNLSEKKLSTFLADYRSPQMAIPSTIEIVNEDNITYQRPHESIVVSLEEL